jgi:hypothetical protein
MRPIHRAHLANGGLHMLIDSPLRDVENFANFPRRFALRDPRENFQFASRQRVPLATRRTPRARRIHTHGDKSALSAMHTPMRPIVPNHFRPPLSITRTEGVTGIVILDGVLTTLLQCMPMWDEHASEDAQSDRMMDDNEIMCAVGTTT